MRSGKGLSEELKQMEAEINRELSVADEEEDDNAGRDGGGAYK